MMNSMQMALIRKELRGILKERGFFVNYLLVPLIFALVFPVGAILLAAFADVSEFAEMLSVMMISVPDEGVELIVVQMLMDSLMPMLFLMIPPLIVTAMAASSFTGEKERRTLETLLYSPMSLRQIFSAKVLGALLLGMVVTVISFVVMVVAVAGLVWVFFGEIFLPGLVWLVVIGLVAPAFSLLAIILQVRISVKARSSEEAFQRGGILVMIPLMLLLPQVTGLMVVGTLAFAVFGVVLAVIAWLLMQVAFRKFTYEELLR